MIRKRKPYKTYSKEFKLEALSLVEQSTKLPEGLNFDQSCEVVKL